MLADDDARREMQLSDVQSIISSLPADLQLLHSLLKVFKYLHYFPSFVIDLHVARLKMELSGGNIHIFCTSSLIEMQVLFPLMVHRLILRHSVTAGNTIDLLLL